MNPHDQFHKRIRLVEKPPRSILPNILVAVVVVSIVTAVWLLTCRNEGRPSDTNSNELLSPSPVEASRPVNQVRPARGKTRPRHKAKFRPYSADIPFPR